MIVFEFIFEVFGRIFLESIFFSIPVKIYEWLTGKDSRINGYRTEQKKFIKFSVAKKFLLTWGNDIELLKVKLADGLDTMNEELKVKDFEFTALDGKTIIQPPTSISFYSFHFLVQCLTEYKIQTVGIVETSWTTYATYNDPNSENLIGRTNKGKKFFITLMEDYTKRQFLRINKDIEILDEFDLEKIRNGISYGK